MTNEPRPLHYLAQRVAPTAFIAPTAVVLGDVTIGDESSIWFHAVLRGDVELIEIGARTNIQDLAVLHADAGFPCVLGNDVTVGHSAIVHGAVVEDDVLIGMRAVVMNGARIGRGSIVAVGSVVTEGAVVPPNSVAVGTPARVLRKVEPRDQERIRHAAEHYVLMSRRYIETYPAGPASVIPRER